MNLCDLAHLVDAGAGRLQQLVQQKQQATEAINSIEKEIQDLEPKQRKLFENYQEAKKAAEDEALGEVKNPPEGPPVTETK